MKAVMILLACIVLGALAGYGRTWSELSGIDNHFEPHNGSIEPLLPPKGSSTLHSKAVVVGGDIFNFKTMERNATRVHTFRIRNDGDGLLTLKHNPEQVSCGLCIECNFDKANVAPGDVAEIVVRYSTRKSHPEFSESARIESNDPNRPLVELRIEGHVVGSLRIIPEKLAWSNLSAAEGADNEVKIYGFVQQPVEVLRHELVEKDLADLFEVSVRQLGRNELAEMPEARSGVAVRVKMKPGAPLGPMRQTIRLMTNVTDSDVLEIPVEGRVVSDINVYGNKKYFHEDVNLLKFGTVSRKTGAKATLFIRVKGPYRDDVKLSIGSIQPEGSLTAKLEAKKSKSGKVHLYSLVVEVPPGTRPMTHAPGRKTPYATIMIETTHPDAKQLPIYVGYSISER